LRWVPGSPVGAGGALTGGEKLFAPPGVRLFSVGVTDGAVVVVVVLLGAGVSLLLLQPAVSAPIVMIAPPPMTNATRRVKRSVFMFYPNPIPELRSNDRLRGRGRLDADVNMMPRVEQIAYETQFPGHPVSSRAAEDQCRTAANLGSGGDARVLDGVVAVEQGGGDQVV
jgi:hypothetical protein